MRIFGVILILASIGCDNSQASMNRPALPASVPGNGIVRGTISFTGVPPVMKSITSTEACCQGEPQLAEETVIVNANGTLKNVFVYLEGAPATDGRAQPQVVLDQVRCRYTPHVLGVQVGQSLVVRSSDPTMHNVHYVPQKNQARNLSMSGAGQQTPVTFDYAEFVRVKCDVHPWMAAWVGVFENPFFAATGDEGSFEIKNIPSGTFKLVAWHERYGRQETTVTVSDNSPVESNFTFGRQG